MAAGGINIGGIYADLAVDSGKIPQGLAAGEEAINAFQARIVALDKMLAAGAIGRPEHVRQVAELKKAIADLAATMQSAHAQIAGTASAVDLMNAKMGRAAGGSKQLAISLMQLGYMADDLQYGFSAVVNNVAPLVHGFAAAAGASANMAAGVSAAAQLAAVAAIQLAHRWNDLRETLGDTTGTDEALRSLDGLIARLKKLQDDANNFSWGERLSKGLGGVVGLDYDPDAGKGSAAAHMEEDIKERKKDEAAAGRVEQFQPDDKKKEEARYLQAVGEANPDEVFDAVARDLVKKKGVAGFLNPDKGPVRGVLERLGAEEGTDLGFVAPPSQVQEYGQLQGKQKAGTITEVERGRMKELEDAATRAATEEAKRVVGRGARDISTRNEVAAIVGGEKGDVIAGKKETKRDLDRERKDLAKFYEDDAKQEAAFDKKKTDDERKNRREADAAWNAEARERQTQVKETVAETNPGLREDADRLAAKAAKAAAAREGISDEEKAQIAGDDEKRNVERLKTKILAKSPELSDDEAESVARQQMDRTRREDPQDRADRLKAADAREVKKADPDAGRNAEAAVAFDMGTGRDTAGAFARGLKEKLVKERGLDEADADEAVKGVLGDARQKVSDRLRAVRGGEGERKEPSRSEVYSAADMSSRIQSAISDQGPAAEEKKANTKRDKQIELLQKIADRNVVQLEVT